MAEYIKPNIYINEFDKSSYITEGATTVTGIVGTSSKGPANEIILVTSYANYTDMFGKDSGYLDFFARFFFKYGGNKLLVVRATDQYNFAGICNGLDSIYEIVGELSANESDIPITHVSGPTIDAYDGTWPHSGLAALTYNGETEYVIYREIIGTDALDTVVLHDCIRGVNATNETVIATWGITVTANPTTDFFETTNPHGLRNGQNIQFTDTECGVTADTNYWVINKTSKTFQVTAINGVSTPVPLTGTSLSNTVNRIPIPTKYISPVCPVVCGEVTSGQGTTTVAFEELNYGQLIVGKQVMFNDPTDPSESYSLYTISSIDTAFNETTRTQTVVFSAAVPAAVDGTWACMVLDPFYGEFGTYTLPMYMNYDAWSLPKYDSTGTYVEKGAGISDPTERAIFMQIYARSCGKWANTDVRISVYNNDAWNSSTETPYFKNKIEFVPSTDDEFLIVVESYATGAIEESWLCSLIPGKTDYWGKTMFVTDLVNDNSEWIRVFVNPDYIAEIDGTFNKLKEDGTIDSITYLPHKIERYYLGGGTDGSASVATLGAGGIPQVREYKIMDCYNLFSNKNEVDIDIISAGGNQSLAVQVNIKSICDTRMDCVGILNIPWGLSIADAVRYKNLVGSSTYSAIYCNGSKVLDSFTGSIVSLPPAIQVTPLIVKTDLIREPWYAVAGYNRGMLNEVIELEQNITDGDFETLYAAGINPIINDGAGPVIYGIKTMYVGSSAFNKLTVRRLMLKMEKDIKNSMKAFLFEPNTFDTRLRIVRTCEPYLESIKARDGIEDFRVICDDTNNTNQTIASGQIICDIYIKPVFAAEYIIFNFTVTKDEISSIISNT
ncbi:MAG: phage tail sheath C-terminal domain-containing protein [Patescibacteria group bacterium]|jgi:hypothetical protein